MTRCDFPIAVLPEPLRTYVLEGAAALDCDPSHIAVPLLPVTASAIGNTRRIRLKQSWTEPSVIWAVNVSDSGSVKSPAFDLATKPLWRRQERLLNDYGERRRQYEAELLEWRNTPRQARSGEKPEPPQSCEHPICYDVTVEALADRLLATPRGICVALEELSGWFGSFNQYKSGGGGDVAHWLSMHGARPLKVDRKTGDRTTIYVPRAAVCVTGTIQPATFRRVLLCEFFENGLAARLLVNMPEPRTKHWTEDEISDATNAAVDVLFEKLLDLRSCASPDGDQPVMIDLDAGAKDRFVSFVNEHNQQMAEMNGHVRPVWAKLEGYAARFALLRHCVRAATGAKQSDYIDDSDIEAGITLSRWFGAEAVRVYKLNTETEEQRDRRELLELVNRLGGRVTPRDLKEHSRSFPTSEAAERALQKLVNSGEGSWKTMRAVNGSGRPSAIFCLADSPNRPARSVPETSDF